MKYIIVITFLLSSLFSQYEIEDRWHLVGYEDNVMYEFEDNYRYSIYSEDGTFGSIEDAGGTPNPYTVVDDIITIDLFFGNIVNYQMNYRCDGQVVEFIENGIIHSTLFREGYNYINNDCQEYGDINGDGTINVLDAVLIIDIILADEFNELADINGDNYINVLDVVQLINIIFNNESIQTRLINHKLNNSTIKLIEKWLDQKGNN